jgi:AAA+ ATPase superfamily predicted ATPase
MPSSFIGRTEELESLKHMISNRSASLVVLKGRRRIGKSRLIEEFAKRQSFDHFYVFSGIPPTKKTTNQSELDEFSRQLGRALNISGIRADDWSTLFLLLADRVQQGRTLILFDEISWMGSKDPDFLGKLKNAWDFLFSKNEKLILVLCGSVSAWVEEHIIQGTGFFGRPSLILTLEELPLSICNQFWEKRGRGVSAYEKFKILSVIGGVPRYLELINPTLSAEENIKQLCFMKHSILLNEYELIFNDIFSKRSPIYKNIIEQLVQGSANQAQIAEKMKLTRTGNLSDYLSELTISGFIERDYTWTIKTGKISGLSNYRLKDNYLRFYLKYLRVLKPKIEKGIFNKVSLTTLPNWDIIMGLQFENLVLNNYQELIRAIGIQPDEIIFCNPFFQRHTARQPGCQIDYLIQTRFDTAYVCEIKFSRFEIGPEIINEMERKIERLKLPRHFSYRPILIHVNGVREDVHDSNFFAKIIDFSEFLQTQ